MSWILQMRPIALIAAGLCSACLAEQPIDQGPGGGPELTTVAVARSGWTNASLLAVWAATPDRAWAGGQGGVLLRWDGQGWHPETSSTTETITGIWGADTSDIWAVGSNGLVRHRTGGRWRLDSVPVTATLLGVWGLDRDHIWIVGSNGTVLRRNGDQWTPMPVPGPFELWGIWGTSPQSLVAVGQNGVIIECCTGGGGERWGQGGGRGGKAGSQSAHQRPWDCSAFRAMMRGTWWRSVSTVRSW